MYQYAKEFKEGEPPLEDDNGDFIDAQGNPVEDTRVSFFEHAEDVIEP